MHFRSGQRTQARLAILLWSLGCVLVLLSGAAEESDRDEAMRPIAVVAHPESETTALTRGELARIFKKTQTEWPDGTRCIPIDQVAGGAIRAEFSRLVLREALDDIKRYWIQQTMTGNARPPIALENSDTVKKYVTRLPGAVAYLYLDEVDDSVRILHVADVPELASPTPAPAAPEEGATAEAPTPAPPPDPPREEPAE